VQFLAWWASNLIALLVAAWLVEGISYDSIWWLVFAALVFGAVNMFVRPLLILLALPFVILTLGILLLFINAFMLWLTGAVVPDFDVADFFWAAVLGALVIWLVNIALYLLLSRARKAGWITD
jgi:putative membrane protein